MTTDVLQLLIAERDKLTRAIEALQSQPRRPGRPPGRRGRAAAALGFNRTVRRGMSAAARKAQSERMKAYWAARRKQKAKS
jgi:hypothetical protein